MVKLKLNILRENKKQNINNYKIGNTLIILKLEEEFKEVVNAIINYTKEKTLKNLKEIIAETFDLIQVCILILWKFNRQAIDFKENNLIEDINLEHREKLFKREWIVGEDIEITIKE